MFLTVVDERASREYVIKDFKRDVSVMKREGKDLPFGNNPISLRVTSCVRERAKEKDGETERKSLL